MIFIKPWHFESPRVMKTVQTDPERHRHHRPPVHRWQTRG